MNLVREAQRFSNDREYQKAPANGGFLPIGSHAKTDCISVIAEADGESEYVDHNQRPDGSVRHSNSHQNEWSYKPHQDVPNCLDLDKNMGPESQKQISSLNTLKNQCPEVWSNSKANSKTETNVNPKPNLLNKYHNPSLFPSYTSFESDIYPIYKPINVIPVTGQSTKSLPFYQSDNWEQANRIFQSGEEVMISSYTGLCLDKSCDLQKETGAMNFFQPSNLLYYQKKSPYQFPEYSYYGNESLNPEKGSGHSQIKEDYRYSEQDNLGRPKESTTSTLDDLQNQWSNLNRTNIEKFKDLIDEKAHPILLVKGLESSNITNEVVNSLFCNFGNVVKLFLWKHRGLAYVEYPTKELSSIAKEMLNNLTFFGKVLRVPFLLLDLICA